MIKEDWLGGYAAFLGLGLLKAEGVCGAVLVELLALSDSAGT